MECDAEKKMHQSEKLPLAPKEGALYPLKQGKAREGQQPQGETTDWPNRLAPRKALNYYNLQKK